MTARVRLVVGSGRSEEDKLRLSLSRAGRSGRLRDGDSASGDVNSAIGPADPGVGGPAAVQCQLVAQLTVLTPPGASATSIVHTHAASELVSV